MTEFKRHFLPPDKSEVCLRFKVESQPLAECCYSCPVLCFPHYVGAGQEGERREVEGNVFVTLEVCN